MRKITLKLLKKLPQKYVTTGLIIIIILFPSLQMLYLLKRKTNINPILVDYRLETLMI